MAYRIERTRREGESQQVPQPIADEPGFVRVDVTWGKIQPISLADGVRTAGEREVIDHLDSGGTVIDARTADEYAAGTIPGARNLYHGDIAQHADTIRAAAPAVLFCNGPQCVQSPDAVRSLLNAGVPPEALLYYRGGVHDWVTLGLPLEPGRR